MLWEIALLALLGDEPVSPRVNRQQPAPPPVPAPIVAPPAQTIPPARPTQTPPVSPAFPSTQVAPTAPSTPMAASGATTSQYPPPVTVPSGPTAVPRNIFLAEHDLNRDGVLTYSELPANLQKFFAKTDANRDGYLDAAEILYARTRIGNRARQMESLRLRDGKLVEKGTIINIDPKAVAVQALRRMDLNADGYVDSDEIRVILQEPGAALSAARELLAPRGSELTLDPAGGLPQTPGLEASQSQPAAPEGRVPATPMSNLRAQTPPPPPQPDPRVATTPRTNPAPGGNPAPPTLPAPAAQPSRDIGPDGLPTAPAILRNLDKNRNGLVDRHEAVDQLADHFKMLDRDKNGGLDQAEIERSLRLARMFGIKPKFNVEQYRSKQSSTSNKPVTPTPRRQGGEL